MVIILITALKSHLHDPKINRLTSALFGSERVDVRIFGPILRQMGTSGNHVVCADQSKRLVSL